MSDRETLGSGHGSVVPSHVGATPSSATARAGSIGSTSGPSSGQTLGSSQRSQGGQGGASIDQAKQQATQAMGTARQKAGQVAEQATAKADQGIDQAATGLDKAADLIRDKSRQVGGQGGAGATAQNVAGTAAAQLDRAARYLEGKDTDQLVADLEALVRRKPTETLLVAAGVGFLLSRIVR